MNIHNVISPTECACERCSSMCQGPCCGTPHEMNLLIESGYGKRLMYDNLPGGEDMIKPALKGFEGEISPWETRSEEGCTFWKDGKCELHSLGLKPIEGKLSHHDSTVDQIIIIEDFINDAWEDNKGLDVIEKWKQINEVES